MTTDRTYTVILHAEPEGGYSVSVPALPGCVTQGETRTAALSNARDAIEVWIADALDSGEEVPVEDSAAVSV